MSMILFSSLAEVEVVVCFFRNYNVNLWKEGHFIKASVLGPYVIEACSVKEDLVLLQVVVF